MSTMRAVGEGMRTALGSPGLLMLLWLINFVVALPLAAALAASIHDSVEESLVHENLVDGFDSGWFGEIENDAEGLLATFRPSVVGAGAFLDNLEAWWKGSLAEGGLLLLGAGLLYALLWAFLQGGVLTSLLRPEEVAAGRFAAGFFGAGGRYFLRFFRLAVLSGLLLWGVWKLSRVLFRLLSQAFEDVTVERSAFLAVVAVTALVLLLLTVVRLAFDFARVATVADERRGMIGAALHGLGFVVSHPVRTLGLYLGILIPALLLLALYGYLAPQAGPSNWTGVVLAFALGQLAIAGKIAFRLALIGGEVSMYRDLGPR